MKAARLHAFNAALELDEVPAPEVTGPFDVIVRVGGAGFCRTDLHMPQLGGTEATRASSAPARTSPCWC